MAWGRKNSIWPFNFGLSCCYVEMATSITSKYDLARFGAEVIRGTPREADLIVIAGTVFIKMAPVIQRLYEQMMEPRWVISMGSCANSGGMYDIYSVVQGVDKFLPVDVYVPGCPPRPDAFIEGLMLLQKAVGTERRPLSWVVGPQGVERLPAPSLRDLKQIRPAAGDRSAAARRSVMQMAETAATSLEAEFGAPPAASEAYRDGIPTFWAHRDRCTGSSRSSKSGYRVRTRCCTTSPRSTNERALIVRTSQHGDFTVVYHLFSFDRNEYIRVKTPLDENALSVDTITDLWPAANWYEREVWDMFGITFSGHPHLTRILMPANLGRPSAAERPSGARDGDGRIPAAGSQSRMPSRRRCGSAPRNGA